VVRSAAEINACRCERLTGSEPGLVGYWRFNEGSGTTALGTLYSNDGELGGGYPERRPTWVASGVNTVCDCPWFAIQQTGASAVELSWPARTNRVYQIDYRSSPVKGLWTPLMSTNVIGYGTTSYVPDLAPQTESQRFYRLRCLTNLSGR
jgi:hypothetical protein